MSPRPPPLQIRRDDPDAAQRLGDELNRSRALDRYVTIPINEPEPRYTFEHYNESTSTDQTISSSASWATSDITQEITLRRDMDETAEVIVVAGAIWASSHASNPAQLQMAIELSTQSGVRYNTVYGESANSGETLTLVTAYTVLQEESPVTYSAQYIKDSGSEDVTITDQWLQVFVIRRIPKTSWTVPAFVGDTTLLTLRRASLIRTATSGLERDAISYYTVECGIATEGKNQIEWIGDGFDGSQQGLDVNSSQVLTGNPDPESQLLDGDLVVVRVTKKGSPERMLGTSVQVVIGRRGV